MDPGAEILGMSVLTGIGMALVYVAARIHRKLGQVVCWLAAGFVVFLAVGPQVHLIISLLSAYLIFSAYLGGTGQLSEEAAPATKPAPLPAPTAVPAPKPPPPPPATQAEPPPAVHAIPRPARACAGCGAGAREGDHCAYCGRPV